jgi:hypothetical protein
MPARDAMKEVMAYSEETGNECGFSFNDLSETQWYFIEGKQERIPLPSSKHFKKEFHTHPHESKSCLPSIDDLIYSPLEMFIGCPKLDKIVSITKRNSCYKKEVAPFVKYAKQEVKGYDSWREQWQDAYQNAKDENDSDTIESLEYEEIQRESSFRRAMNLYEKTTIDGLKNCKLIQNIDY